MFKSWKLKKELNSVLYKKGRLYLKK